MSKMAEFHADIVEMVLSGISFDNIIELMVAEGYPREACPYIIDQVYDEYAEESDGQPDEAQEWESFDPDC